MSGSLFDAIMKLVRRDSSPGPVDPGEGSSTGLDHSFRLEEEIPSQTRMPERQLSRNIEMTDELSQEQIDEFYEAFALFDKDGDGTITGKELNVVLRGLGQNPTDEEIKAMIAEVDSDGSGAIEFSEFLQLIANRLRTEDVDEELKDAFKVFDKNRDGFLSAEELREALVGLGEEMSSKDIEDLIRAADINQDGLIDYTEFASMMLQE